MKFTALPIIPFLLLATVATAADPPTGASGSTPVPKAVVAEPEMAAPNVAAPGAPGVTSVKPSAPDPTAAKATADIQRIRERAGQVDPKVKEATEKSLRESSAEVDAATAKKEKMEVAGRLAAEFGGVPELYIGERERLKTGWGELSIAHTILANAKTTVTVDQLYDLRQEGLGWGQIAHGLDLNVGEFTAMAHAKGRAAAGTPGGAAKVERADAAAGPGAKVKPDASVKAKSDATAKVKPAGKVAAETKSAAKEKK